MDISFEPNGAPQHEEDAMLRQLHYYLTSVLQVQDRADDDGMDLYLVEDHAIWYDPATKEWTWYSGCTNGFTQKFIWLSPVRPLHMTMPVHGPTVGSVLADSEGQDFGYNFFKDRGPVVMLGHTGSALRNLLHADLPDDHPLMQPVVVVEPDRPDLTLDWLAAEDHGEVRPNRAMRRRDLNR